MRVTLLLGAMALGCGGGSGGVDAGPAEGALFFAQVPGASVTGATLLEVRVELRGSDGTPRRDDGVVVTLDHDGAGTLSGALEAPTVGGLAVFADLRYDGCDRLTLRASAPGVAGASAAAFAVAPELVVVEQPSPAQPLGPLPPFVVEARDAAGRVADVGAVPLVATALGDATLDPASTLSAELAAGTARFDAVTVTAPGRLELSIGPDASSTCPAAPVLTTAIFAAEAFVAEPVFLEGARVGASYADALPGGYADYSGRPPAGLALDAATGVVSGTATEPAPGRFEATALDGATVRRFDVHLPVFGEDALETPPPDVPEDDGPWDAAAVLLSIPVVTTSRGDFRDVAVRVAFPAEGGEIADGRFPLVAFHHAAHDPPDIFDDYTTLHAHWASHGFVVASVDSQINVRGQPQSWSNLSDMSLFQRAAAALLVGAGRDPASPFFEHVDEDVVWVSGHSRGGGASLISLWEDPSLTGAICFEPVSPLQTPGQEWGAPDRNGDRPLPARPILLFVGARDADEPWPLVDVSFEQTVGPAVLLTIHGANHEDTYDEGTAGRTTSTSTIPIAARHDIDRRWSTAFLRRFSHDELGFEGTLFGAEGLSTALSSEGVSSASRRFMDATLPVDDFATDDTATNLLGGDVVGAGLTRDDNAFPYDEGLAAVGRGDERAVRIRGWARSRRVAWDAPGASLAFTAAPGDALDLGARRALLLRIAGWCRPPGSTCAPPATSVDVVLRDEAGGEGAVALSEGLGAVGLRGRHWSNAALPLSRFPGVDPSRLTAIELRFGAPADLWLDDLRFE